MESIAADNACKRVALVGLRNRIPQLQEHEALPTSFPAQNMGYFVLLQSISEQSRIVPVTDINILLLLLLLRCTPLEHQPVVQDCDNVPVNKVGLPSARFALLHRPEHPPASILIVCVLSNVPLPSHVLTHGAFPVDCSGDTQYLPGHSVVLSGEHQDGFVSQLPFVPVAVESRTWPYFVFVRDFESDEHDYHTLRAVRHE